MLTVDCLAKMIQSFVDETHKLTMIPYHQRKVRKPSIAHSAVPAKPILIKTKLRHGMMRFSHGLFGLIDPKNVFLQASWGFLLHREL